MLTFQLFIVGIPSCYNVFTSIGGVGFDFHLKRMQHRSPHGCVWGMGCGTKLLFRLFEIHVYKYIFIAFYLAF